MAQYFAVYTQKQDPKKFTAFFTEHAAYYAKTMAGGKTPAKCIKTWNPGPYGLCFLPVGSRETRVH
jgi:hypothetical protein